MMPEDDRSYFDSDEEFYWDCDGAWPLDDELGADEEETLDGDD